MRNGTVKRGDSLDALVRALCRDFSRRTAALERGGATRRTLAELRYLNIIIADAAAEIVGERAAPLYISEIGDEVGYAKSRVDDVSEVTYKRYKQLVKANIAKRLHLDD